MHMDMLMWELWDHEAEWRHSEPPQPTGGGARALPSREFSELLSLLVAVEEGSLYQAGWPTQGHDSALSLPWALMQAGNLAEQQ